MLWRWILTVPSVTPSRRASSRLRRPLATMRTISISRGVRRPPPARPPASRRSSVSSTRLESCFSSHCSPACTFRTHSTRSWGASSLSTTPRTPSRSAAASTTTLVGSFSRRSVRRISSPSPRGMRRSRIRMSGRCRRTATSVSSPLIQRATTWKSGSRRNRLSSPSSTMGWSSASARWTVMSGVDAAIRQRDLEVGTVFRRIDLERPTERLHPLLEQHRPQLQRCQRRVVVMPVEGEPVTVVGHRDAHLTVLSPQGDAHLRRAGVAGRVDQGFLDDVADFVRQAVGDARAQRVQQQFDLQPPHALKPAYQLAQALVQARLAGHRAEGAEFRIADEEAEVTLLFSDQPLDLRQTFSGRLLMGLPEPLHRFELQGRAGQRLKDAVVQVARQADALFRGGGLLQSPGQQKVIHGGGHVPGDNLAQYQVIRRERALVEREEASVDALPVHARTQHGSHAEPRSQLGVNRYATPLLRPSGRGAQHRRLRQAGVRGEKTLVREGLGDELGVAFRRLAPYAELAGA